MKKLLLIVQEIAETYYNAKTILKLLNIEKDAILFNLSSGAFRILFFIIYLFLISRIKDVSRLFQYHGAEHKVVYNFESGKDISIKNAQSFSTLHPRCGTSFMFIVLLSAIFVFAAVDTITIYFFGTRHTIPYTYM